MQARESSRKWTAKRVEGVTLLTYLPIAALFLWAFFNAHAAFMAAAPILISLGMCFGFLTIIIIPELEWSESAANEAADGLSPGWLRIWRRLLTSISIFQAMSLLLVIALTLAFFDPGLAQGNQRFWCYPLVGAQGGVWFILVLLQGIWGTWRLIAAIPHSFY